MMSSPEAIRGTVYDLPLLQRAAAEEQMKGPERPWPESLLVQNALWFCRFRWLVIAALLCYGAVGLVPGLTVRFGIRPPGAWPFAIAGILTLSNGVFLFLARTETSSAPIISILWGQIVTDLTVLTVVVYFVGSLETNIAFAYLFHIVLAQ